MVGHDVKTGRGLVHRCPANLAVNGLTSP